MRSHGLRIEEQGSFNRTLHDLGARVRRAWIDSNPQIRSCPFDLLRPHTGLPRQIAFEQSIVGQRVGQAGPSASEFVKHLDCGLGQKIGLSTRHADAMGQIGGRILKTQRPQLNAHIDSLVQACMSRQSGVEFRGPDEQQRQHPLLLVLHSQERSHLRDGFSGKSLSVVDDQNRMSPLFVHHCQSLVNRSQKRRALGLRLFNFELASEPLQNSLRIRGPRQKNEQSRVEDLLFERFKKTTRQQGFSGARQARQNRQSLILPKSALDSHGRIPVARAVKIEAEIGIVSKGVVQHSEVLEVFHGSSSSLQSSSRGHGSNSQTKEIFLRFRIPPARGGRAGTASSDPARSGTASVIG